jgi:hypothetical protein
MRIAVSAGACAPIAENINEPAIAAAPPNQFHFKFDRMRTSAARPFKRAAAVLEIPDQGQMY